VRPETIRQLKLKNNVVVELAASSGQSLVARIAAVPAVCSFGLIQINRAMRVNLGLSLGESLEIRPMMKCETADCVALWPISDTIE